MSHDDKQQKNSGQLDGNVVGMAANTKGYQHKNEPGLHKDQQNMAATPLGV